MRILLLFLLLSSVPKTFASTTDHHHHRRILHQPFFPQDSFPPSQPPIPSPLPPSPKIPFSTSTSTPDPDQQQPFFPTYPSPPPPPPSTTSSSSFPANISSLAVPKSPKRKPISSKLIGTAVAAVLAAVTIIAIIIFLHIRKRRKRNSYPDDKPRTPNNNGNSSVRSNNVTTNLSQKSRRKSSQSSSEFLYLGTLVNSHSGVIDSNYAPPPPPSNDTHSRKLESPELRPLPPLTGQSLRQQHQSYPSTEFTGSAPDEEDNDEFYSPRGSIGMGSRRNTYETKNFEDARESGSTSSTSYSSSDSGSPLRSVSLSISPPVSLSPKNFSRPKSPELVAVQTAPLPLVASSSPTISSPERDLSKSQDSSPRVSNVSSDQILLSPGKMNVFVPSPPGPPPTLHFNAPSSTNSSSPERDLIKSQDVSPRLSSVSSGQICRSPERFSNSVPVTLAQPPPPPPPPPPPLRHWESPKTPNTKIDHPVLRPPDLIRPSRPVILQSPPLISPVELPQSQSTEAEEKNEEAPKLKLKPLHWDKVRASSDREMVWDQLRSSSFKLNEEMIETLFVVNNPIPNPKETIPRRPVLPLPSSENRVLDPKKSQNIAILLRALNVTIEEVCEALVEGNADNLGTELLESLLKMAPTKEEERKLKEYTDDSPFKLGPAERFLKAMLDIPFAFRRVDAMFYISNFDSEIEYLKRSFTTLEEACDELRNNRMFLKLLEAVLKTGNRMNVGTNRGDAHAFKLDTLLKLVDVKGADGKTTLLHFVVQEIIRSEGSRLTGANQSSQPSISDDAKCRKLGLQVVSNISSELSNVKKAAAMDSEVLNGDVLKLSKGIGNIAEVVRINEATGSENSRGFSESMNKFVKMAEEEIIRIQAQESVALSLVKEITEYFHGNSAKEEAHPFRIFMVVRDFLAILDRVCKEVGMINERTIVSSAHKFPVPVNPTMPPGLAGFPGRQQYSSSDDESSSP